jgi:predicted nuclease with TOPRIM domain
MGLDKGILTSQQKEEMSDLQEKLEKEIAEYNALLKQVQEAQVDLHRREGKIHYMNEQLQEEMKEESKKKRPRKKPDTSNAQTNGKVDEEAASEVVVNAAN